MNIRNLMRENDAIACDIYGFAEAACRRDDAVALRTRDGQSLVGRVVDIQSTDDAEFLVLVAPGVKFLVRLSAVTDIRFDEVA